MNINKKWFVMAGIGIAAVFCFAVLALSAEPPSAQKELIKQQEELIKETIRDISTLTDNQFADLLWEEAIKNKVNKRNTESLITTYPGDITIPRWAEQTRGRIYRASIKVLWFRNQSYLDDNDKLTDDYNKLVKRYNTLNQSSSAAYNKLLADYNTLLKCNSSGRQPPSRNDCYYCDNTRQVGCESCAGSGGVYSQLYRKKQLCSECNGRGWNPCPYCKR